MKSIVILNDFATEGSKNKQNQMSDLEESSGKGHFNEGPDPKTWSIYVCSEESSKREFFVCKSSSFSLLLQFTSFTVVFYFWGGDPRKLWLLIDNKFNLL